MLTTRNLDLRMMARTAGIPIWRIAEELAVSPATLYRFLNRRDIASDDRQRFIAAIHSIAISESKGARV